MSSSSSSSHDVASSTSTAAPKTVVIAGAGIVGISTAYYLAIEHGIRSVVIDPTGSIAPAASGKAGGFLAYDWNDSGPALHLARRSFRLHSNLASSFGDANMKSSTTELRSPSSSLSSTYPSSDRIMYRRLTCSSISVDARRGRGGARRRPSGKKLEGVEWVDDGAEGASSASGVLGRGRGRGGVGGGGGGGHALGIQILGDESTIAQVHPKMLCDALWSEASKPAEQGGVGSELRKGEVVSEVYRRGDDDDDDDDDVLVGAKLSDGTVVPADAILYACGPWTKFGGGGGVIGREEALMTGVKYHSAVIPTSRILSQAVFFDGCGDPEVYPRPDRTAYCTGFPDPPVRVTERPGEESVRDDAIERIVNAVRDASGGKVGALGSDPIVRQACYLPTTPDGLPIMGRVPRDEGGEGKGNGERNGCYVAAGHGCWGILMGPATGEAMAELIATGCSTKVDLTPFDPLRFDRSFSTF